MRHHSKEQNNDCNRNLASKLSWEEISHCLSGNSPFTGDTNSSLQSRRLKLRILDTVFLDKSSNPSTHCSIKNERNQIKHWFFTSKKCDITRRKDPSSLILQHLNDRFCRFSLANAANSVGPRIVAVGFSSNDEDEGSLARDLGRRKVFYTEEQFKREVKNKNSALFKFDFLQCYMRPCEGEDLTYRCIFKLILDPNDKTLQSRMKESDETLKSKVKKQISVYLIEDAIIETSFSKEINTPSHEMHIDSLDCIQKEVEALTMQIVNHLEHILSTQSEEKNIDATYKHFRKVLKLRADFVLDDNKQLWLTYIDNVRVCYEDEMLTQINKGLIDCNEIPHTTPSTLLSPIHSNKEKFDACLNSQICQLESERRKKNLSRQNQKKTSEQNEKERKVDKDHKDDIQIKIAHLSAQLKTEETAKVESLVQITNLRQEAQAMFKLQPLNGETNKSGRIDTLTKEMNNRNMSVIHYEIDNSSIPDLKNENRNSNNLPVQRVQNCTGHEVDRARHDLKIAKQENESLLREINNRGSHLDVLTRLQTGNNNLEKQLQLEVTSKNELIKKLQLTSTELAKSKALTNLERERHESIIKSERDRSTKVSAQIKSTNEVLETEIKVQRDYVDELKLKTWMDFGTKLKREVETVISQELVKSSMGVSQAVGACEERWRIQLKDLQLEHQNEVSKMRGQFENDIRLIKAQNLIKLNESSHLIEQRLTQDHEQALGAILQRGESERILELKTEAKKWEQTIMEMKIRIIAEQQQKARKYLIDRDNHWQSKLLKFQQESETDKKYIEETLEYKLNSLVELKEKELSQALEAATKEREEEIQNMQSASSRERLALSAQKDCEINHRLELESAKYEKSLKEVLDKTEVIWADKNDENMKEIRSQMERMQAQYEKKEHAFYDEIECLKNTHAVEIERVVGVHSKSIENAMEKARQKMKKENENDLLEVSLKHNKHIEEMRREEQVVFDQKLRLGKEEAKKSTQESLQHVVQEYEEQIQTLEYDLSWQRSQKETADGISSTLELEIESKQTHILELEEKIKSTRAKSSVTILRFVAKALSLQKACIEKDRETILMQHDWKRKGDEKENGLRKKIKVLEKRSLAHEERMKLVASTLLNHKRDELIHHKTVSRDVALKIQKVTDEIKLINSEREDMMQELSHMEDGLRDVEVRLQHHSQTSAIQGGKININHARKKRRLDEEYEQILSNIELKRDELKTLDENLGVLTLKKSEQDDKMRGLERSLVELLVEQQKKLLSISCDGGNENTRR